MVDPQTILAITRLARHQSDSLRVRRDTVETVAPPEQSLRLSATKVRTET